MPSALDIGTGDAHIPGAIGGTSGVKQMAKTIAKTRRARRAIKRKAKPATPANIAPLGNGTFRFRMSHPDGSHTIVHHKLSAEPSTAYYDTNTERFYHIVPIDKQTALSAGEGESKRVWVQVARTGAWAGHPQGAFQITEQKLDEMIANFHGQGFGRIPWDFEHISAMPANSGNLPNTGKPAQGWIYGFRREGSRLYALTEWKDLARQYIESDQYQGVSPVIDWNGKDRVSGEPIGAMITSVALTQWPFISGMSQPIAASIDGTSDAPNGIMTLTEVKNDGQALSSAYGCHSALAMLPQLKSVFGLHELTSAREVSSYLSMLRTHLDAAGGDGTASNEGVDLGKYFMPLRTMTNAHAGMDWYAILDIIDELMDAYLEQHGLPEFEETHGPIPGTEASAVATAASAEGIAMSEPVVAATVEPVADKDPVTVVEPLLETATVTAVTAASATSEPSPELAALTLKNAELAAMVSALSAERDALKAKSHVADESALAAEVDAAILTYKDTKGLTEELRPHLLSMLKATPDAFRATYPAVEPDKQHLLLNLTGGRVEADAAPVVEEAKPSEDERIVALGLYGLTKELMAQDGNKLSIAAATSKAERMLRTAQRALNK